MRMRTILLAISIGCCTVPLLAQITEITQHPETIYQLQSLGSGVRYIQSFNTNTQTGGSRTIYNLDLTVHRVLNYPAPPSGMQWGNMGYITEELFDTDPSTIEFTMVANQISGPGDFATFIFREDGDELFSQNPGSMVAGFGGFLQSFNPIFTVDDQTYMIIYTSFVFGEPTRIYALPGILPCMDCYGSPTSGIITGGATISDPFSGLVLQPNPAQSEVLVTFGKNGIQADAIVVLDATGREVLRQGSSGPAVTVKVSQLATGSYTVLAIRGADRIGSLPLIITR